MGAKSDRAKWPRYPVQGISTVESEAFNIGIRQISAAALINVTEHLKDGRELRNHDELALKARIATCILADGQGEVLLEHLPVLTKRKQFVEFLRINFQVSDASTTGVIETRVSKPEEVETLRDLISFIGATYVDGAYPTADSNSRQNIVKVFGTQGAVGRRRKVVIVVSRRQKWTGNFFYVMTILLALQGAFALDFGALLHIRCRAAGNLHPLLGCLLNELLAASRN